MKGTILFCLSTLLLFAGTSRGENAGEVGKIALSGKAKELIQLDQVKKAYLGM